MADYFGIQVKAAYLQTDKIIKDIQSQLNNIQGLSVKISKSALESGFQQNVQTALNQMAPVALKIDTASIVLQIQKALKEANISVPTSSVSAVNSATSSRSNKSSAPSTQRVVRSEADGTVPMDKERTQSYKDLREVIKDIWSYREKIQRADSDGTGIKGLKAELKLLQEQRQTLEKLIEAKGWYDEALKQDVTKWENKGSRKYNETLGNKADANAQKQVTAELKKQESAYKKLKQTENEIVKLEQQRIKLADGSYERQSVDKDLDDLNKRKNGLKSYIQKRGYTDPQQDAELNELNRQNQSKLSRSQASADDKAYAKLLAEETAELKQQESLRQKAISHTEKLISELEKAKKDYAYSDNDMLREGIDKQISQLKRGESNYSDITDASKVSSEMDALSVKNEDLIRQLQATHQQGLASINDEIKAEKRLADEQIKAEKRLAEEQEKAVNLRATKNENLGYEAEINDLAGKFSRLGMSTQEVEDNMRGVRTAYKELQEASPDTIVSAQQKYNQELTKSKNQFKILSQESTKYTSALREESAKYISTFRQVKLENKIRSWLKNNTAATKEAKEEMQEYLVEVRGDTLTVTRFNEIDTGVDSITTRLREMGKLGNSFINTIQAGAKKFFEWTVASTGVMRAIQLVTSSLNELKEIDTTLTEISKTSDLTTSQLRQLGADSFDVASKYGKTANDYLLGQQEMYRAGFTNADGMAELSTLAQAAGDMTADLANDYLIASNAAFEYNGNVEKLNALLDGQNQITNRNAVSMEELANATKTAGSLLANVSNLSEQEMSALLGTGIATSRESGETVARALRSIMMNLQGVAGEGGFEGEEIDAEQLKKVEARCHSLGVELEYMKDGIASLRDPIEVLRDLSEVYNSLPEDSAERAGMIADIGGKYRANVLSSILSHFDQFDKMMADFENSQGSAYEEAMKSANNWE